MKRYLLDANIIINVTNLKLVDDLMAWMAEQADHDLFIAALTIAEIGLGVFEKPAGKCRRELDLWMSGPEGPQALFAGRILPLDEPAALIRARLTPSLPPSPKPMTALWYLTTNGFPRH